MTFDLFYFETLWFWGHSVFTIFPLIVRCNKSFTKCSYYGLRRWARIFQTVISWYASFIYNLITVLLSCCESKKQVVYVVGSSGQRSEGMTYDLWPLHGVKKVVPWTACMTIDILLSLSSVAWTTSDCVYLCKSLKGLNKVLIISHIFLE